MTKDKLTIIVMVGPPASGKSFWAKNFVKGKSTWIRVNRDDLRLMCGDYWIPSREKLINILEESTITSALKQGYNVVIDSTNLNPKTKAKWKEIALNFDANIEYKEIVIPYHEAVKRDKNRDLQVGEDTIRMFYRKYYPEMLQTELNEL